MLFIHHYTRRVSTVVCVRMRARERATDHASAPDADADADADIKKRNSPVHSLDTPNARAHAIFQWKGRPILLFSKIRFIVR